MQRHTLRAVSGMLNSGTPVSFRLQAGQYRSAAEVYQSAAYTPAPEGRNGPDELKTSRKPAGKRGALRRPYEEHAITTVVPSTESRNQLAHARW